MAPVAGLVEGQTVRARGARSIISRIVPSTVDPELARIDLRVLAGETAGQTYSVFVPIDEVIPEAAPELDLGRISPFRNWQAFHDAFRFELAAPPNRLVAVPEARVAIDPYQRVPAERLLALPRPRLLIADDVGLGKTIEAGLAYLELAARRRARRVLIVAPASICEQWRDELHEKFGIDFEVFDRDRIDHWRRQFEIGANPWQLRPRVIVSLDLAKLETTFPELSRSEWDLAIVDEAHHVSEDDGDKTLNRRFAEWLARNASGLLLLSATPHNGSDESFASLLQLLEPRIAPSGTSLDRSRYEPYVVRRLKGDVRSVDGTPRFVPRDAVRAIPVDLDPDERKLHDAVVAEVKALRERARASKGEQRTRLEFLATIVRKRAASSRAALTITLERRKERVAGDLERLTVRRDLLRRYRASEPLTEEEQADVERDLVSSSLQGSQARLAREARALGEESDTFAELARDARALEGRPESKMLALVGFLQDVWAEDRDENVLVFSEYQHTAEALAAEAHGILRKEFGERVMLLHGDVPDRAPILGRFTHERGLVLVATDVASEGLNLQDRSRTLVHYDLPWNPNRLEQRNGRVDRYGQRRAPRIAFLYAAHTYDGELLRILMEKIERQVKALGSVGDVLGELQYRRVEALLVETPDDVDRALVTAAQKLDDLLASKPPEALTKLSPPKPSGAVTPGPEAAPLVIAAVQQCGGRARAHGNVLEVEAFPPSWSVHDAHTAYALPGSPRNDLPLLTRDVPLVRTAVGALRELRYDAVADPRIAAVVRRVAEPLLIATFLLEVRAEDGTTEQRVIAPGLASLEGAIVDGEPCLEPDAASDRPTVAREARAAFETWWRAAHERLAAHAQHEAETWAASLQSTRAEESKRLQVALNSWYAAERAAATVAAASPTSQLGLTFDGASLDEDTSPSLRKKLDRIEDERERQERFFGARLRITASPCDPLGVLLVMPESR